MNLKRVTPRQKRKKKRVSEDAYKVVIHLKNKLMELGVDFFPRNWTNKNLSTATRLLQAKEVEFWTSVTNWCMTHPYWAKRSLNMTDIEDAAIQYVRQVAHRDVVIKGVPMETFTKSDLIVLRNSLLSSVISFDMPARIGIISNALLVDREDERRFDLPWIGMNVLNGEFCRSLMRETNPDSFEKMVQEAYASVNDYFFIEFRTGGVMILSEDLINFYRMRADWLHCKLPKEAL